MKNQHLSQKSDITVALAKVSDISRYGYVRVEGQRIVEFHEKKDLPKTEGLINSGIYLSTLEFLLKQIPQGVSSFEKDVIPRLIQGNLGGFGVDRFFIDIGIPADFERAQTESFFNQIVR